MPLILITGINAYFFFFGVAVEGLYLVIQSA